MKLISVLSAFVFMSLTAWAEDVPVHGFTPKQIQEMVEYNKKVNAEEFLKGLVATPMAVSSTSTRLPFAEYEHTGYILFSDSGAFDSYQNKLDMAKNVPDDVTVVIFTANSQPSYQTRLFTEFSQFIPKERLKIIYLPNANNGFWARDGIPVPTWTDDGSGIKKFTVVDAKYYFPFEADEKVSQFFGAEMVKIPYYHEGGNFMTNTKGNCVVVNNVRAILIPDTDFQQKYGCKTVLRFPHIKGIGHIDEALKFVDDDTVLTDTPQYVEGLENAGFEVIMLPRPNRHYETYANAILINGVAFVPVFNQPNDSEALRIYRDLGYTVFPLPSVTLSNDGLGSLHCITMTYPPVPFNELLAHTGGHEVVR